MVSSEKSLAWGLDPGVNVPLFFTLSPMFKILGMAIPPLPPPSPHPHYSRDLILLVVSLAGITRGGSSSVKVKMAEMRGLAGDSGA
jgi:hypothetical protein